jgi:hypothetical protein
MVPELVEGSLSLKRHHEISDGARPRREVQPIAAPTPSEYPPRLFEILHFVQDDNGADTNKRLGLYGLRSIQIKMAKRLRYMDVVSLSSPKDHTY